MFNFGIPNSFSVYCRLFFFAGIPAGFVFCCLGGGAFSFLDTRLFDVVAVGPDLLEPLEPFAFLEDDLTVLVGPMVVFNVAFAQSNDNHSLGWS